MNLDETIFKHAAFHRAAGPEEAITVGKYKVTEKMLAPNTEYAGALADVAAAMTKPKKQVSHLAGRPCAV